MDGIVLGFALSAGMASAFNPCGTAILPSYLAYLFVQAGFDDAASGGGSAPATARRVLVGLWAGLLMTAGFILVFVGGGLAINVAVQAVRAVLPWLAILVGALLVVVGLVMLAGRKPAWFSLPQLMRLQPKRTGRGWATFFLYGLAFATASLSCTLPIFLVVVAQTFAGGFLQGIVGFVLYALGMGLVVTALSVAVALARETVQRWLGSILPAMERLSAVLIIVAGAYLLYYWLWGPGTLVR